MIRHVVLWRVRGDTPAQRLAHAQTVCRAFEAMRGRVPGLRSLELGIDESRVEHACDVALVSEFDSREALAAYASHPEHERAKQAVAGLRVERYQADYAIAAPASSTG